MIGRREIVYKRVYSRVYIGVSKSLATVRTLSAICPHVVRTATASNADTVRAKCRCNADVPIRATKALHNRDAAVNTAFDHGLLRISAGPSERFVREGAAGTGPDARQSFFSLSRCGGSMPRKGSEQ